jgi:V/A-type H+-transporting ATPase subunit I
LLWGLYFLIQTIVFKKPLPGAAIWLIGIGFGINFIFVQQEGNFFKGFLSSFKNIIPIALNSISCFSDIISYVRLFAVGLATVKVAEAFNEMAAGVGFDSFAIVGSIFILIFGHSLNMVMAGMSVMVHGVRLKMLEFSGHMELQWSGTKYKPFS